MQRSHKKLCLLEANLIFIFYPLRFLSMDNKQRAFIYAFLSTVFSDKLSKKSIQDLKDNPDFLDLIGENARKFFDDNDVETLDEELNIDFTSAFLANSHPAESFIMDAKHQISTSSRIR